MGKNLFIGARKIDNFFWLVSVFLVKMMVPVWTNEEVTDVFACQVSIITNDMI